MVALNTTKVASSDGRRSYEVTVFNDGSFWCTCPAMKFQKGKPAGDRQCKHTRQIVVSLVKLASN